jgi:tetratricopeptide (TPR) repeat protein
VNIAETTVDPASEARARRNWELVRERLASRRRDRRIVRWSLVTVAPLIVLALSIYYWPRVEPPAARSLDLPPTFARDARLSDGSRIVVMPGAVLETIEDSPSRAELWLRRGEATFDLEHGARRWIVATALGTVEVLGTRFTVNIDDSRLRVSVERGSVLVRSPHLDGGIARLGPSQVVEITRVAPAPPPDVPRPAPELPAPPARRARAVEDRPRAPPMEPTDPLDAADVLRSEGRDAEAAALLEEAEAVASRDHASLLAFTRARIELERLNRPSRAATAFERALALGLPEALREDARAGQVQALAQAGEREAARTAAAVYLRDYPRGRWRTEVERWSAP